MDVSQQILTSGVGLCWVCSEKARRRDPRIYNYLAIPCEATKQVRASCQQLVADVQPGANAIRAFEQHAVPHMSVVV